MNKSFEKYLSMKNLYIILTPTIKFVGGAQIYSLNKLHYYERKGWETKLFHANLPGEIIIEEMNKFEANYLDEFKFFPFNLIKKKAESVIFDLIRKHHLNEYHSVIIESHNPETALWGELMAEKLQAKHFVFLLSEFPKIKPSSLYDFYDMKLSRGELAGIADTSIQILFDGYKKVDGHNYSLIAYCSNSLGHPNIKKMPTFNKYDYLLCSIGRMEKPYLLDAVEGVVDFALLHQNFKIALLFIGDGDEGSKNKIKEKLLKANNIQFKITGPIYPIPINLIEKVNLCFGVAGACNVSHMLGKLTVSFDVNDHKPIGIYGITTENDTYRNINEPKLIFSDLLDDILVNNKYRENPINVDVDALNAINFKSHEEFIFKSASTKEYFNIFNIKLNNREFLKKLLIGFLGINMLFHLKNNFLK